MHTTCHAPIRHPSAGCRHRSATLLAIIAAATAITPAAQSAAETPVATRFVIELHLDTVSRFGAVHWTAPNDNVHAISLVAGSAGVPTFGGFWGRRYSEMEPCKNGEEMLVPDGRSLKLELALHGPPSVNVDALPSVVVAYQPLASSKDTWMSLEVPPSRWAPREERIGHIPLRDEIVTPHVAWGKPAVRGPVNVLFLVSFDMQREIIELNQRFDMTFDAPSYVKYGNRWADASVYRYRLHPEAVIEHTAKLLDENTYDVVVIAGLEWTSLGSGVRERLVQRIENGMGVVLCMDPRQIGDSEQLAPITPLRDFVPSPRKEDEWSQLALIGERKGTLASTREHFITTGVPLAVLPPVNYFPYRASHGVIVASNSDPVAAIGRYGRGRVVQFAWSNPDYWGGTCAMTPSIDFGAADFPAEEYFLSQIARAIRWSARREPDVRFRRISHQGQTVSAAMPGTVEVSLENTRGAEGFAPSDPVTVDVTMTVRDRRYAVVGTETQQRRIEAGTTEIVSSPLPVGLVAGLHFADWVVRVNDKVENWGSAHFTVANTAHIKALETDRDRYAPNDRIQVTVDIEHAEVNHGLSARYRLFDTHGRLLGESTLPVGDTATQCEFALRNASSHFMRIEVALLRNERVIDLNTREIEVEFPHQWDDYEVILWGFVGTQITGYVRPLYFDAFRDMGITTVLDAVESPEIIKESARANFGIQPIGGVSGTSFSHHKVEEAYAETGDKNVLARKTCLSDPDYWNRIDGRMRSLASTYGWLGPTGYNLGDEFALIHTGVPTRASQVGDICFSSHCTKRFVSWLRDRYESLDALNRQWGSDWKSWEAVRGATRHEMRDVTHGNYAPWADHRTYMDDVFVTAFERWQAGLSATDSHARIGMSGQSPPSCYNGFDYAKVSRAMRTMVMYIWISQGELWSSLAPGQAYTHWAGYGQPESEILAGIWFSVAYQHHGIGYYKVPWFITPDLRLNDHARFIRDNLRPIREGIGKIAMTATKDFGQIAILYSQPSMRAAWITSAGKPMARESIHEYHERDHVDPDHGWDEVRYLHNLDAYCMLLKAAGLGYRFVSDEQVDAGMLEDGNVKAIILPFAMAVSDRTATKIRTFVEKGGMAVADVAPGVMDEHATTRSRSVLSDLFGADFQGTAWQREPSTVAARDDETPDNRAYRSRALGALPAQAVNGRVMATIDSPEGSVPGLIATESGAGRTVFLNFFLSHLNDRVTWQRDSALLLDLFDAHGIQPQCTMTQGGQRAVHYESNFLDHGPLRYLVLRRWDRGDDLDTGTVDVTLPAPAHLYDVRDKRYLGFTEKIEADLPRGDGRFYALLPYRVTGLDTRVAVSPVAPGQDVTWTATVKTQSTTNAAGHVIRLRLIAPDGKARDVHTLNTIATDGTAQGRMPIALNAPRGHWHVEATDVASGVQSTASFVVE